MSKQEMITFINNLPENADKRVVFVTNEIMDDGRSNTRTVFTTKEKMLERLSTSFDDNLHGSFRDGMLTTIVSYETAVIPE